MRTLLLAMSGGALGAGARYLVNHATAQVIGPKAAPLATLAVNILGSFAMGVIIAWLLPRGVQAHELRTFLATGIIGGFTTFSAFSLDAVRLAETSTVSAVAYITASVGLSILALLTGYAMITGPRP